MCALLAESPLLRPDILIATALLAVALLLGAVGILFADRWKKKAILTDDGKPVDDLSSFRAMFERGELTEQEYEKVRLRTAERMKQQLGIAPPAAPNPNLSESPPAPPAD